MRSDALAVTAAARLGEAPLWDAAAARLMWVDLLAGTVHAYDPARDRDESVAVDGPVAALALLDGPGYLAAAGHEVGTLTWPDAVFTHIATVHGGVRTNDGGVDPAGRFLIGTMSDEASDPGGAALFRVERGGARLVLDGATISNGLDWSPDGSVLYYVDTPLERVDAFDYDVGTGAVTNRRVFADLSAVPGRPDGLCVDADGGVWVAMARGGAAVRRFDPSGSADHVVELPVPHATSVAFGGDSLRDLYVTTSQLRMTDADLEQWPLAGALFRVDSVGVRGREPHRYVR
ncbi:sugar lactone lactonase YvrE [Haloactinopolyspora alba]|uniref:Sugar lactone lactonase YvrE n=1 Tax=Haloactinopolyspora alba TaxID=648780 RepID=A0A2P8EG33_9ACTN|nr:SMP-30/gluconolactonase/LRE family protein [Haloactinopolyspora alba]PSL08410.1 sugar lactone lactonase YvrE [Haloactinopolyspora alba]